MLLWQITEINKLKFNTKITKTNVEIKIRLHKKIYKK